MNRSFVYDRPLSTKEFRALVEQWNPKIKPCRYGGFYVHQQMKAHGPIYYLNMSEENVFFWATTLEWNYRVFQDRIGRREGPVGEYDR